MSTSASSTSSCSWVSTQRTTSVIVLPVPAAAYRYGAMPLRAWLYQ